MCLTSKQWEQTRIYLYNENDQCVFFENYIAKPNSIIRVSNLKNKSDSENTDLIKNCLINDD